MSPLVESLRRLYMRQVIPESKIIELFNDHVITEQEKTYILSL